MEDRHRFRVYDKKYREYMQGPFDKTICAEDGTGFTVFAYKCNHLGARGITTLFEAMAMPDRFVVEQCTGLKDRTGKLIFEGDTLRPSAYKTNNIKFVCEVIFINGCFCFKNNGGLIQGFKPLFKSLQLGRQANNEYEIIGNIHETEA